MGKRKSSLPFATARETIPLTGLPVVMDGMKTNPRKLAPGRRVSVALFLALVSVGTACAAIKGGVTSINAVGYLNLRVPPGYSLVSVPLLSTNTLSHIIPSAPNGTTVIKMVGDGFQVSNYLNGWTDRGLSLVPGEGFFIRNPTSTNWTFTIVGGVLAGRVLNRLPAGYSVCSSIIPQYGNLTSRLQFSPPAGTVTYQYDNVTHTYITNLFDGIQWIPAEPRTALAEAFQVRTPVAYDWLRVFYLNTAVPLGKALQPLEVTSLTGTDQFWIQPIRVETQRTQTRLQSFYDYDYQVVQPQIVSQTGEVNLLTFHNNATLGLVQDVGISRPVTPAFFGQLYAGFGSDEADLAPAGPVTRFFSGRIAAASVKIPGTTGGQTAYFQLRAWEARHGRTYEEAASNGGRHGKSAVFPLTVQSPVVAAQPGLPLPDANQFPSFNVQVGWDLTPRFSEIWITENYVNIGFVSEAGKRYRLEYKEDLAANWIPIGLDITATVSGITQVSQPLELTRASRVYRVCRLP